MPETTSSSVTKRPELNLHSIVTKPWGYELIFAHTLKYAGKILHVFKGKRLSLQLHNVKEESMFILSGEIVLTLGYIDHVLEKGESVFIPARTVHRVFALEDTDILEVSTPELYDVVRLSDDYGRA
jgi:mannose-6-phosphate isomerase